MTYNNEQLNDAYWNVCNYLRDTGTAPEISKYLGMAALYINYTSSNKKNITPFAKDYIIENLPSKILYKEFLKEMNKICGSNNVQLYKRLLFYYPQGEMNNTDSPVQIAELVCRILDVNNKDVVFDFGSGIGSFLSSAFEYSIKNGKGCRVTGNEINSTVEKFSEMFLEMLGANYDVKNSDGLTDEKIPEFSKGYVYPPIGLRYSKQFSKEFSSSYGKLFNLKTNSEWMFVVRALEGLKKGGRLVALLPAGTLFRSTDQYVRKYLVDNELLEGIIALPQGIIPGTMINSDIIVIGNSKKFKMLDASKMCEKTTKRLTDIALHLDDIVNAYNDTEVKQFDKNDAIQRDYNLSINSFFGTNDFIDQIVSPKPLNKVAEINLGTQYTLAHFKNVLSETPTNFQILTSGNIDNGLVDYDSLEYIKNDNKLLKFELKENDVVVTTKSTKVKTMVAQSLPERHIIVTGGMIIVRPNINSINPTYLKMFLDSELGQSVLKTVQKGTIITTISTNEFKDISVACPDKKEQDVLAKKYNQLLYLYDGIKQQLLSAESEIATFYMDSLKGDE